MKKYIIITISVIVALLVIVIGYKTLVKKSTEAVLPSEIVNIDGHKEFPGPQWGLTSIVCEEGGFDILSYAGKKITIKSSLAIGRFYKGIPLNIITINADDRVICEYYAASEGSLTPGVFSVNDPNITGK